MKYKILCLIILNIFLSAATKIEYKFSIIPNLIKQGEAIILKINTNYDLSSLTIKFNNNDYPIFKINESDYRVLISIPPDIKPGGYTLTINEKNNVIIKEKINIYKKHFYSQSLSIYSPKLSKEEQELIQKEDELVKKALNILSEKQLWEGEFIKPLDYKITAPYGIHRYVNGKYINYHTGIDIAGFIGTPIKSTNSGIVVLARYLSENNSNGNIIVIDHGLGVTSCYLHLSKILVKEGDKVKKGQIIGNVGTSGKSTGPHLHWGLYINGKSTDGIKWINLSKYF